MDVVVAGGHGKIAQRLLRLLAERGDRARGLVRNADHVADLEALGAEAIVCDLEHEDPTRAIAGGEAVVFAAGAGPGSGPERKRTVDFGGAVKLIAAAKTNGIGRYLMVSAMGTGDPAAASEQMRPYLLAKAEADAALRGSDLDWTIVKPGRLTNEPGTGLVDAAERLGRYGEVPRDDVAAVLAACLGEPGTVRKDFELLSGEVPVAEAVRALV